MKFLLIISALLLPVAAWCQPVVPNNSAPLTYGPYTTPITYNGSTPVSFVRTWTAKVPLQAPTAVDLADNTKFQQTTAYSDGLGRPLQKVVKAGSPDGTKDIVSTHVYDEYGREAQQYLPYAATPATGNEGKFKLDPFAAQRAYYQTMYNDQRPYGEVIFEASPLNRPQTAFAPGNSWMGSKSTANPPVTTNEHATRSSYEINSADEVVAWNIGHNVGDVPVKVVSTYYAAGELYRNIITDEHNNQVIEYKDKQGQVILKKVELPATAGTPSNKLLHTGWLCTYYVYDDFGLLRFVMQPKAVEWLAYPANNWTFPAGAGGGNIGNELCFHYEYDSRNRMVVKKVPGAGEVWMVYDKRDRLAMTQDANQRNLGKWLVTQYDALNRTVRTYLWANGGSRSTHEAAASATGAPVDYPSLSGAYEQLTETYYDDYSFTGVAGFNAAQLSAAQANYQQGDEYADNSTQSGATRGMVTGSKTRVLDGGNTWLNTTIYYDDKGRTIQVIASNHKGGTDITSTQYSFTGKPISIIIMHANPAATLAGTQTTTIQQTFQYQNGYAVGSRQKINNSNRWQPISTMQYDDLGKNIRKEMGIGYSNILKFYQDYAYNIRGWLSGINLATHDNIGSVPATTFLDGIFAMRISYEQGFTGGGQYNGNISGISWTHAGDKVHRAFGYSYDAANRLKIADFTQVESGSWVNSTVDFSVSNLSYDANGNIMSMTQKGLKLGGSDIIDQLNYTYQTSSSGWTNKLEKVVDTHDDPDFVLGDFNDGGNGGNLDYNYDGNGNLTADNNKAISSIIYNHLNLPKTIIVNGKGTIEYIYDAGGNKLQKKTTEGALITRTDYVGAFEYKNDNLQQVAQPEGRVRYAKRYWLAGDSAYTWEYDYFYKDHLGNVRTTVTEQKDTALYQASFESQQFERENALFARVGHNQYNISDIPGYPADNTTSPNNVTSFIDGVNYQVGVTITLKVMVGDTVRIGTKAFLKYNGGTGTVEDFLPETVFAGLFNILPEQVSALSHGVSSSMLTQTGSPLVGALSLFTSYSSSSVVQPKAFLNWILIDEQFQYVPQGSGFVQAADNSNLQTLASGEMMVVKSGYLTIFVSNQSPDYYAYFDNLAIEHKSGPLLQEDDYYPFGLTTTGISSKAAGKTENKKKYNGIEYNNDFDLNIGEAFFRTHDPQLGRWWQIDPKPEYAQSLYSAMDNNPILKSDFLGDTPTHKIVPLFVPQKTMPGIFVNTLNAFANGQPHLLTYDSNKKNANKRRDAALANHPKAAPGNSLDEYPLATTTQGGAGASVKEVPLREQKVQGGMITAATSSAKMVDGDQFFVIPIPNNDDPALDPPVGMVRSNDLNKTNSNSGRQAPIIQLKPSTSSSFDVGKVAAATAIGGVILYGLYKAAVFVATLECGGCGVFVTP